MVTLYYLLFSLFILVANVSEITASASLEETIDLEKLTQFRSIQHAIKTLIAKANHYSIPFKEWPTLFEAFNYPDKEYLSINYQTLYDILMSKKFNTCESYTHQISLIMNNCIEDSRKISPRMSSEILLKIIGNRTPSPTKKLVPGLRISKDPDYWNPLPISPK